MDAPVDAPRRRVDTQGRQPAQAPAGQQPAAAPPQPAPQPPLQEEVKPIEIVLRRPIVAHDGERKSLVLREPTVRDIEKFGLPVSLDFSKGTPNPTFDPQRMTQMLAMLANVTPREIQALDPRDWTSCAWAVAPFFVPDFTLIS